jgi:hypothetical protein
MQPTSDGNYDRNGGKSGERNGRKSAQVLGCEHIACLSSFRRKKASMAGGSDSFGRAKIAQISDGKAGKIVGSNGAGKGAGKRGMTREDG